MHGRQQEDGMPGRYGYQAEQAMRANGMGATTHELRAGGGWDF